MSYKLDWNNLASSGSKKGGNTKGDLKPLNFIKFTSDSKHIVRPVGAAHGFWRFWYAPARRYIIADVKVDDEGKTTESNLEELKELLGCDPEQRFAMNVIDRSDEQIKILQGPMSMAQDFAEVAQQSGNNPGSSSGGDWRITSTGAGKSRRYRCNFIGPQPFTKEELARIKNPDKEKNEWYMLEQVYKPSDMEYVNKIVGGESTTTTTNNPTEAKTNGDDVPVGVVVGDDDLDF